MNLNSSIILISETNTLIDARRLLYETNYSLRGLIEIPKIQTHVSCVKSSVFIFRVLSIFSFPLRSSKKNKNITQYLNIFFYKIKRTPCRYLIKCIFIQLVYISLFLSSVNRYFFIFGACLKKKLDFELLAALVTRNRFAATSVRRCLRKRIRENGLIWNLKLLSIDRRLVFFFNKNTFIRVEEKKPPTYMTSRIRK